MFNSRTTSSIRLPAPVEFPHRTDTVINDGDAKRTGCKLIAIRVVTNADPKVNDDVRADPKVNNDSKMKDDSKTRESVKVMNMRVEDPAPPRPGCIQGNVAFTNAGVGMLLVLFNHWLNLGGTCGKVILPLLTSCHGFHRSS